MPGTKKSLKAMLPRLEIVCPLSSEAKMTRNMIGNTNVKMPRPRLRQ
jgi:hypothetical protein